MPKTLQVRRDTAANWTSNNPTLAEGEMGIETDTLKLKMGDGVTTWTSLAYYEDYINANQLDGYHLTGTGASQANTTPSAFTSWASQAGTARKVPMYNAAGEMIFDYIKAYDIFIPAQISAFYARTTSSSVASYEMVGSNGTDTMQFRCDYLPSGATITSLSIDITAHTYGGGRNPEVNAADYPDSTWTNYCNAAYETSQAINRGQVVGEYVTFTATATVNGQSVTKNVNLTFWNKRIWGQSSNAAIDSDAEVTTFHDSPGTNGGKELSNSKTKAIGAMTIAAGNYFYYIHRAALGYISGITDAPPGTGFPIDMVTLTPDPVSWTNPNGFVENVYIYRSTNHSLGTIYPSIT